jgi:hypothetical protein
MATKNSQEIAARARADTEAAVAVRRATQAQADIEAAAEADREVAHGEDPVAAAVTTREGEAALSSGKNISKLSSHTV